MGVDRRGFLLAGGAVLTAGIPASAHSREAVDVAAILREGLSNSRAMTYAAELADGIGARLTGSPNMARAYEWALSKMSALGLEDVRLEPVPMPVMGWQQTGVSLAMAQPDNMPFVAQAGPWSMGTRGVRRAQARAVTLASPEDYEHWRGKLAGKLVLLGPLRDVPQNTQALTERYSDEEVLSEKPLEPVRAYYRNRSQRAPSRTAQANSGAVLQAFLEAENVAGVILPSRDGAHGGGSGNLSIDESPFAPEGWSMDRRPKFPFAYAAIEHFGRAWRLASSGIHVELALDISVEETADYQPVWNVVADFKGRDPGAPIVVAGAHLDSWSSGTGALDNASGVSNVLEVVRILKATGYRPRQTLRVVLFGAEEQGLLGAKAYAQRHLATHLHSIMFNMDGGAGRARGVFSGGDAAVAERFAEWIKPLKNYGLLSVFNEPFWPADQSVFSEAGVPGVMFLQDPLDYFTRARHSNMDTIERLPSADMAQLSTALAVLLAQSGF